MRNLLEQAIESDDGARAAKIIRDALGIESDEIVNYSFPRHWPDNPEQRARVIGDWRRDEARFLVAYPRPKCHLTPTGRRTEQPSRRDFIALYTEGGADHGGWRDRVIGVDCLFEKVTDVFRGPASGTRLQASSTC